MTTAAPYLSSAKAAAPRRRGRPVRSLDLARVDVLIQAPSTAPAEPEPHLVEVVESYFDPCGRPIKRKSLGAARVARSYDASGNQIEECYYNADGSPAPRKGLGAARIHWRYDERGNRIEAEFFGPDGAALAALNETARREFADEKA